MNLKKSMHYHFIEIGTSDFDTVIETVDHEAIGISVDPLLVYLKNLPVKQNTLRVLGAISDSDGFIEIFYVPPEISEKYNLPWWVRGCNSVGDHHPSVRNFLLNLGFNPEDIIAKQKVIKYSVKTFLEIYQIAGCDYLKIDTEGHDLIILKAWIDAIHAGITKAPQKILFESNQLTPKDKVDEMIDILTNLGYKLIFRNDDVCMELV